MIAKNHNGYHNDCISGQMLTRKLMLKSVHKLIFTQNSSNLLPNCKNSYVEQPKNQLAVFFKKIK